MREAPSSTLAVGRLCLVQALVAFEFALTSVALPSTGMVIGGTSHPVDLVIAVYAVGLGAGLMVSGRLADAFGHHRVLLVGTVGQLVSCLVMIDLPYGGILAARAVHGLASAAALSAAFAMVTAVENGRGDALRWWGTSTSIGFGLGTLAGGVIGETSSWRTVFVVLIVVSAAVLAAVASIRAPEPTSRARVPDLWASALAALGLFLVLLLLSELSRPHPAAGWSALFGVTGALCLAGFGVRQRVSDNPVVPRGLLARRSVRESNGLMAVAAVAGGSMVFFVASFTAEVLGWSGVWIGLALLPDSVAAAAGAQLAGRLASRGVAPLRVALAGFAAMAVGGALLAATPATAGGGAAAAPVVLGSSAVGFGLLLVAVTSTIISSADVEDGQHGVVGGLLNSTEQVSVAFGLMLLVLAGSVVGRIGGWDSVAAGLRVALAGASLVALTMAAVLASVLATDRRAGVSGRAAATAVSGAGGQR